MPGKGHIPELTERIVRSMKANTNRTAGGLGSNASPGLTRDRIAASARTSSGIAPSTRSSKVDWYEVSDTSSSSFTLTYVPIANSWNVTVNGLDLDEDPDGPEEFQIVGRTLTITNPADTFKGVTSQAAPWRIRVQYDYLTGAPTRPTNPATFTGNAASESYTQSALPRTLTMDAAPAADGTVLLTTFNEFGTSVTPTGLGATWTELKSHAIPSTTRVIKVWIGTGCDGSGDTITVTPSGNTPQAFAAVEVADATAVGALTAEATAASVGPLVAPSQGGIAIAYAQQNDGVAAVTAQSPRAWSLVTDPLINAHPVWIIELNGGESASIEVGESVDWVAALVASA